MLKLLLIVKQWLQVAVLLYKKLLLLMLLTMVKLVADRNNDGFFKVIDGTTFAGIKAISCSWVLTTFAIGNFLLVLPTGEEKIVKLVFEGEAEIVEANAMATTKMLMIQLSMYLRRNMVWQLSLLLNMEYTSQA
jgi:hypothetical protein